MNGDFEILRPSGRGVFRAEGDKVTIGKRSSNDIVVDEDVVSRLHAVIERFPSGWVVRDLDSRNGTFLNGERLTSGHALRHHDEIRVGATRVVFRARADETSTAAAAPAPPRLTTRERDVLLALCRPVLAGSMFTDPAPTKDIAAELVISEETVKDYMRRLYDKFRIEGSGRQRRLALANDAIIRGAIGLHDLRD